MDLGMCFRYTERSHLKKFELITKMKLNLPSKPGHHTFKYAIYPHPDHFMQSNVVREAYNFNVPLLTRWEMFCLATSRPRCHPCLQAHPMMIQNRVSCTCEVPPICRTLQRRARAECCPGRRKTCCRFGPCCIAIVRSIWWPCNNSIVQVSSF